MTLATSALRTSALDPAAGLTEEDVRRVVDCAGRAPSVHNAQPWRFVAHGNTIGVHADDARRLACLDPEGRLETISCGAAVEYASLAVRGLGRSCVVRLLPDSAPGDAPLATLTIGRPHPVAADDRRLVEAMPLRHTDRGPYDATPVPAAVLQRVREVVAERGCWMRTLDRPGDRLVASRLLQQAEEIEASDPLYGAELAAWRRLGAAEDGVPAEAAAVWDSRSIVSDMPLRDFSGREHYAPPGPLPPPEVERDTVILIGSDDDSRHSWMRAGRAIAAGWLTLAAWGISAQPLAQVTDIPLTRVRLRRELGLLGQPQLMVRVGYGHAASHTGRRPVAQTLHVASPTR